VLTGIEGLWRLVDGSKPRPIPYYPLEGTAPREEELSTRKGMDVLVRNLVGNNPVFHVGSSFFFFSSSPFSRAAVEA